MRKSRRSVAARLGCGSGEVTIRTAVIDERCSRGRGLCVNDFADEDGMIASWKLSRHFARQRADRAADERHAELAAYDFDAGKLVVDLRREAPRHLGLLTVENADSECSRR